MRGAICGLMILAAPAAAADDNAARFATRPAATRVALSPDGDRVVYIGAYKTGGRAVYVADTKSGEVHAIMAGSTLELQPRRCGFKTETRLICTLYGVSTFGSGNGGFTRIVAVDIDGKNLKMLSQRPGLRTDATFDGGALINWLPDDPKHVLMQVAVGYTETVGSLIKASEEGIGAAIVDIDTGGQRMVEPSRARIATLGADGQGSVRLRGIVNADADGYARDRIAWSVRPRGSKEWQPLGVAKISDARSISFDGFDASGDHLYQLASVDGRTALFALATDGSNTRELVYSRPDVDVDGIERIGKYDRPVGVTYTLDRGEVHYFDPELERLSAKLTRALPGHPDITIVDESWDGSKKLIFADSDRAPGHYYLYDNAAKTLGPLLTVFPSLEGVTLGSVQAVSFTAHDGTKIPGYLTLPPGRSDARGLPGLVMPHGGPSARDTAGFDFLAQFFAAEGFAVLQPNFRGSAGYGDAFFAHNGFKSWPLAIGDVNDGARWLVAQGVPAGRLAIFGWSYGGYAALQANVVEPTLYRATIAVAPVTDLDLLKMEGIRDGSLYITAAEIGSGPHVLAGSPARHAAAFVAPVLLFHGDRDLNVEIEQSRAMAGALRGAGKKVELVEFKNLDHQLDDSAVRTEMLAKSAAFLKAAMN